MGHWLLHLGKIQVNWILNKLVPEESVLSLWFSISIVVANSKSLHTWKRKYYKGIFSKFLPIILFPHFSLFQINFSLYGLEKKPHGLGILGERGKSCKTNLRLRRNGEEVQAHNFRCHVDCQTFSFITFSPWFLHWTRPQLIFIYRFYAQKTCGILY